MAHRICPLGTVAHPSYAQPMQLSNEQIQSFIECWQKDFGETLTPEQARVEALRLLEFFAVLADILRSDRPSRVDPAEATTKQ